MSKYSTSFKLAVVEHYLTSSAGYQTVGRHHGIDHAMVRKWVSSYCLHGKAGLQKKFTHYSAAFKLSVLQHMWAQSLSYGQTAAVFDIRSHAMVGQWERLYHSGGIDALKPRPRGRPKTMPVPRTPPPRSPDDQTRTRDDLLAELN